MKATELDDSEDLPTEFMKANSLLVIKELKMKDKY